MGTAGIELWAIGNTIDSPTRRKVNGRSSRWTPFLGKTFTSTRANITHTPP